MKRIKINLILIISIICLILFIGIFIYFLNVIKNKNEHTSVVISTLNGKIKDKENINILQKKINELEETNKKIGSYIADTSSIDTFVGSLEKIGVDNNVSLTVNGVDIPKNTKNIISVRLSIKGEFPKIMNTIANLENSPYYMNIISSYINKEIKESTNATNSLIDSNDNLWQADLIFSVLSK